MHYALADYDFSVRRHMHRTTARLAMRLTEAWYAGVGAKKTPR